MSFKYNSCLRILPLTPSCFWSKSAIVWIIFLCDGVVGTSEKDSKYLEIVLKISLVRYEEPDVMFY